MMTIDAIVLGGGIGKRFQGESSRSPLHSNSPTPKQFHMLLGKPVFVHAVESLWRLGSFRNFILTFPEAYLNEARDLLRKHFPFYDPARFFVIAGGERRQDSSHIALSHIETVGSVAERVLIHDACRPFLSPSFLQRIKNTVNDRSYAAWIPAVPVVDTIKRVGHDKVLETIDRNALQRVQTPQVFEYEVLRQLSQKMKETPELQFTDDASLCEYYGIPVGVFEGDVQNIKLTYDFELKTLTEIMEKAYTLNDEGAACESESVTTFTV